MFGQKGGGIRGIQIQPVVPGGGFFCKGYDILFLPGSAQLLVKEGLAVVEQGENGIVVLLDTGDSLKGNGVLAFQLGEHGIQAVGKGSAAVFRNA